MIRHIFTPGALALAASLLLSATAHAQLFRAYLASDGSDTNACTLPAPCRLLPAALAAVADGGQIWMLDSANYNNATVNITKSVTILAIPGAVGSVLAAGGNAITIATAGVRVALRNLVIVPLPGGGGTNGINISAGYLLTLDQCLIANLPGIGVVATGELAVRVTNSTIRDNGSHGMWLRSGTRTSITHSTISGNADTGVYVYGFGSIGAYTVADIAASTLDGNGLNGVVAFSDGDFTFVRVSLRDSLSVRSGYGAVSQSDAGGSVVLSLSHNTISHNSVGVLASGAGSKVWATGNTVSGNTGLGLLVAGGIIESAGDNAVRNNAGGDTSGTITVIATQ